MIISRRDQEEINRLYTRLKGQGGGRKEDYFGLMYLGRKFKSEPEDLFHNVTIGEHPYGINGYFVDTASRNLYLFCLKWTERHADFRDPLEALATQGMDAIFGSALSGASNNALMARLRADLYEHKAVIDRIFIQLVFKGSADAAEQSAGLHERREAVENKRYLVDSYFGARQVDLVVEYVADKRIAAAPPPATYTIDFEEAVATKMSGDRRLHVGFVRLIQLVEMYKAFGQRFLDRNIRSGLSPEKSANRHIREALAQIVMKRIDEPEVFSFNHNGVTLSAEEAQFGEGTATLRVPRLLNGAQTITSVAKFLTDNADSAELRSGRDRLDRIRVLAKLIEFKPRGRDDDFIATITVCNNRQNAVEPWNLRANDRIQCDLQDKLREDLRIFYSRQERSFENMSEDDLEDLNIADAKDIRIKPLAQTFLAVQGEVDRMSRLPDVFETQKIYLDTFRESYLKVDSRRIVLAYKLGLVLNTPVKRMTADAPQWLQPAIPKARNLIWALLIQGLFNDHRCDEYLDQFGTSLVKESLFRDLTASVAANRILPVFRSIFIEDGPRRKIEGEKYAFLRTKEVFRRCVEEAANRYGWSKRSL